MRSASRVVALASVLAGTLSACGGGDSVAPPPARERYPLAEGQGVDPEGLQVASTALAGRIDPLFILVERHGVVVMEDHFNGSAPEGARDVRSVTKSVMSVLFGIAIDQGLVASVHETIGDYLGPVVPSLTRQKARITIQQLLTMTSGIPWRELASDEQDYGAWVSSPDPLLWILSRPLEHPPGEVWNYNTGATHILSAILTEATETNARDFAQRTLFGPLGEQVGPWVTDNRGYCFGGHGISLRGSTMIKLGRLMMDGGLWQGRRIVSADWVAESTRWHNTVPGPSVWAAGTGYGYLWWLGHDDRTGLDYTYAVGYGGQFIVIVPDRDTVIAAATRWNVRGADRNFLFVLDTIIQSILPSLRPTSTPSSS